MLSKKLIQIEEYITQAQIYAKQLKISEKKKKRKILSTFDLDSGIKKEHEGVDVSRKNNSLGLKSFMIVNTRKINEIVMETYFHAREYHSNSKDTHQYLEDFAKN